MVHGKIVSNTDESLFYRHRKSQICFRPIYMTHELFDILSLAVLVVDVKSVLIGVDYNNWNKYQPQHRKTQT